MRCQLCNKRTWWWQDTTGSADVEWYTLPNGKHEGKVNWDATHYHIECVKKHGVKGWK